MNAECLSADSIAALVKVTPGPQKRTLQAAALPGAGLQRVVDEVGCPAMETLYPLRTAVLGPPPQCFWEYYTIKAVVQVWSVYPMKSLV